MWPFLIDNFFISLNYVSVSYLKTIFFIFIPMMLQSVLAEAIIKLYFFEVKLTMTDEITELKNKIAELEKQLEEANKTDESFDDL